MWVTNNLGYDVTFGDITIYKSSQQEFSSADATKLNKNSMFVAMTTAGTGLVKSDSQPAVNPQYFVRPLSAPTTLDGMPTNPEGYPAVSPAEAFEIGKSEGGDADLEDNHEVTITENGELEITPAEGKDGMKKVTATVNVSGGMSGIMPVKFVGFKASEGSSGDAYVAFFDANGAPITDKTLLTLEHIAFAITSYKNLWINPNLVQAVTLGAPLFDFDGDTIPIDNVEYSPEEDAFFINSNASYQETDSFYDWSTAELINSLDLVTITPLS